MQVTDTVARIQQKGLEDPVDETRTIRILLLEQTPTVLTLETDKEKVDVCEYYTLSGKLTDRMGNPLALYTIKLYWKTSEGDLLIAETSTESDGSFAFPLHGDSEGTFTFYAVFEGSDEYAASVSPEVTVAVGLLALTVEVVVKGTVPAVPVEGAVVTHGRLAGVTDEEETYVWFEHERQTTGPDGKVTFYVEPDIYAVHVVASGYREKVKGSINVAEDTTVTIELEPIPLYEQLLPFIVIGGIIVIAAGVVARR